MKHLFIVLSLLGTISARASVLSFEEVGELQPTDVSYFEGIDPFDFETIRCNCQNTANHQGIGVFNAVDNSNSWIPRLHNTPENVTGLSHDIDTRMTLSNGGPFNLEGAYLGSSHFQSPTLFLSGYRENKLIYSLEISIPNIYPNGDGPSLVHRDFGMVNIDRVEWSMSRINIGTVTMDTINYFVVPAPSTLALMAIGLAGVRFARRRKLTA